MSALPWSPPQFANHRVEANPASRSSAWTRSGVRTGPRMSSRPSKASATALAFARGGGPRGPPPGAPGAEGVVVGVELQMLHHERRHVLGSRYRVVHQGRRQELAVLAVPTALPPHHAQPPGETADDLPADD